MTRTEPEVHDQPSRTPDPDPVMSKLATFSTCHGPTRLSAGHGGFPKQGKPIHPVMGGRCRHDACSVVLRTYVDILRCRIPIIRSEA